MFVLLKQSIPITKPTASVTEGHQGHPKPLSVGGRWSLKSHTSPSAFRSARGPAGAWNGWRIITPQGVAELMK